MQRLNTNDCLEADIISLARLVPEFGTARELTGALTLRKSGEGFSSLARTIIGQQVSVASANAIWGKLDAAGLITLANIARSDFDTLRANGLSRQKATYLLALADAGIDFESLPAQSNETVLKTLTAVKGIGKWTAEIYLMFALGRRDVFASGDLALQEGTRILFDLDQRPSEKQMRSIAAEWSCYQNAAAHLLWAYYHVKKERSGI